MQMAQSLRAGGYSTGKKGRVMMDEFQIELWAEEFFYLSFLDD